MKLKLIREGLWLTINLMVAVAFLWLSSKAWIEPAIWNRAGASGGDPALFGRLVAKVLGPLLMFNLAWLACTTWWCFRRRDWSPAWTFAGMGFMWTGLVIFSASKIGN